jgi:hypothetical protein
MILSCDWVTVRPRLAIWSIIISDLVRGAVLVFRALSGIHDVIVPRVCTNAPTFGTSASNSDPGISSRDSLHKAAARQHDTTTEGNYDRKGYLCY